MIYETQDIARKLKAAREGKKLSQRALSDKAGVLQAQISKIENGTADLRVSTLVALARALDLEVVLVPRQAVAAVQSIVSAQTPRPPASPSKLGALIEAERLRKVLLSASDKVKATEYYAQLQRSLRDIQRLPIAPGDLKQLRTIAGNLKAVAGPTADPQVIRDAAAAVGDLRTALAARAAVSPAIDNGAPAYSLDDEDADG